MVWDPLDAQWNECYELAKKYYKEKGNLLIPHQYTINNIKLGRWIGTQRGLYKDNNLSRERILLLENIGIDWNPIDTQWNECYEIAKKYYNIYGNLLIPTDFIINNTNIGRWVATQRANYKLGVLTNYKTELLEDIGMIWEPYDTQWKEYYDLAKEYYKENGNLLISIEYTTNQDIRLGNWIHSQRRSYRENRLSKDKIELLEKIGMVWDPLDAQWNNYYNLAVNYYNTNNNLLIPLRYKTKDGIQLGAWIGNQRSSYKENKLSEEKITLLEKIGMIWNTIEAQWGNRYNLAVKYYKENGDLLIPISYITEDKIKLGSWINTQRYNYKESKLSDDQISLLEKIGMVWNTFEAQWNECYDLAKKYYSKNGNLLIPISYITEDNNKLGLWIASQRSLYRENKLSKERIELLEKIGMVWDSLEVQWNEYYYLAVKYYNENGNLLVPLDYTTKDGIHLGYWIGTQRGNYKSEKISSKKMVLLEKIGMVWNPFDTQWNEYYNLLVEYYKENGNSLVPLRYITKSRKQLGSWVSHQRINYKLNKISSEKIKLLEKIGMVWNPEIFTWNETYKIAKQYYKENNNLNVPNVFFYKNVNLGSWIQTQRNNYNQYILTDNQIKMLNEIGMEWDQINNREYIWDHNYDIVLAFFQKYNHLYIPTNYIAQDGTRIGIWLSDQKIKYKKNKLSEYRKSKLDMLDKSWMEPSNTKSSFPEYAVLYYIKKYFPSATKLKTKEISEIDIYIPELIIGIEYDGPTHIKSVKRDIEKSAICDKLGIKLVRIRDVECPIINDKSHKIILEDNSFESLDNGIIELLIYLNIFEFDVDIKRDYFEISDNYIKSIDLNWYNMYEKLVEYKNKYGDINVPIYYKTFDGFMLGHWLSNIRSSVKNPSSNGMRINTNKIELLEKLGIDWSPVETQWKKMYGLAKKYYKENGNLLIPDKYIAEDNLKLGRWIGTQRGNYKNNKLSKEKIELLENIGMDWNPRGIK